MYFWYVSKFNAFINVCFCCCTPLWACSQEEHIINIINTTTKSFLIMWPDPLCPICVSTYSSLIVLGEQNWCCAERSWKILDFLICSISTAKSLLQFQFSLVHINWLLFSCHLLFLVKSIQPPMILCSLFLS